jgi:hypothetical protein
MWGVENFAASDGEWFSLERPGAETVSCVGSIVSCKSFVIRLQIVSLPFCSSAPMSNLLAIVFKRLRRIWNDSSRSSCSLFLIFDSSSFG